jgi:hypothetical protein
MKEVSVLGVLHNFHSTLFADIYSLDDLATILRGLRPECVLAELPPDWEARYTPEELPDFKMEYREVILPLAGELGYRVVPVDYASSLLARECVEWDEKRRTLVPYGDAKDELLSQFEDAIFAALPRVFRSPQALHSDACRHLIRALKDTEALWFSPQQPDQNLWEQHNRVNYQHILEAIRSRPEQKFLITFGLYHQYWFEARLQQEDWLRYSRMEKLLSEIFG